MRLRKIICYNFSNRFRNEMSRIFKTQFLILIFYHINMTSFGIILMSNGIVEWFSESENIIPSH